MANEAQLVNHMTINGKYRIKIERAASTKGIDGFVVEVNGDVYDELVLQAETLYAKAKLMTAPVFATEAK